MFLASMTWDEVDLLDRDTVVLAPFAAIEQHSLHLPVATDTLIAEELSRRADVACGGTLLVLPVQWLGLSLHHRHFAGTITATPATYIQMATEILSSLVEAGFLKILVLNSHGGNVSALDLVLANVRPKYPATRIAVVTYWKAASEALLALRESPTGGMGHACELETSLMLAIDSGSVRKDKADADGVRPRSRFLPRDMLIPGTVSTWEDFSEVTKHGGYGDPTTASADKGQRFLQAIVLELAEIAQQLRSGEL